MYVCLFVCMSVCMFSIQILIPISTKNCYIHSSSPGRKHGRGEGRNSPPPPSPWRKGGIKILILRGKGGHEIIMRTKRWKRNKTPRSNYIHIFISVRIKKNTVLKGGLKRRKENGKQTVRQRGFRNNNGRGTEWLTVTTEIAHTARAFAKLQSWPDKDNLLSSLFYKVLFLPGNTVLAKVMMLTSEKNENGVYARQYVTGKTKRHQELNLKGF